MRQSLTLALSAAIVIWTVLAFAVPAAERLAPGVEHLQSLRWHYSARWFGGFSGLSLTPDGRNMMALTDKARLVEARLQRDESSKIVGVEITKVTHLRDPKGRKTPPKFDDTEGLAISEDGFFIASESPPGALFYDNPEAVAKQLPRPRGFWHAYQNKSFEAIALSPRGTLVMLGEGPSVPNDPLRIWTWRGDKWRAGRSYPQRDGFLPVGADFGPDGRFYVLERNFAGIGFRSRLRRFDWGKGPLQGDTTLLVTAVASHDNLEGVSVWRDAAGHLRATMISDDNFIALQRTEIVEYRLPD